MPRYEWPEPLTLEKLQQILSNHPLFTDPRFPVTDTTINISTKHADRNVILNNAAGVTATLPKASGTGDVYKFTVGILATANSHIIKCGSTADNIVGMVMITDVDVGDQGTVRAFATGGSTTDTITMNRSTTGSATKGEFIELQDIANNTWSVRGMLSNTGIGATPFGSTVN